MPKLSYVPLTMINYVTITYTPSFDQTFTQGSFLLVMFLLFIVVKLTQRWEILFKIIKSWHMLIPTYHSAAATSTNPITSILWHVHYHLGLFQTQIT